MSVREDARRNLELAGMFSQESDYNGMIGNAVMALVDAHCDQGHSGMSSSLTLHLFNKVISGHALTAKYWDEQKEFMQKFAMDNTGEPWKPEILEELIGKRPEVEE